MARILLTGFTAKQRGEGRPQVMTLLDGAQLALEYAGHYVERRKVLPDENLRDQFDVAVIAVYDYRGTSATAQKFNTIRAAVDLPHILAWDDWGASKIFGSMRKGRDDWWELGLHKNDDKVAKQRTALINEHRDTVNMLIDLWAEYVPNMLCCSFNWGRHDVLAAQHNFEHLCCWDPSPFIHGAYGQSHAARSKEKQWALASLWNHDKWVDEFALTWPIEKICKPQGRARGWQEPEADVVKGTYGPSWGVLSPPYAELARSGWWRNRFVFANDMGCVLCADPVEVAEVLGDHSWYYWTPRHVETMSDDQLRQVATKQAEELRGWEKSQRDSAKELSEFVLSVA